MMKKNLGTTERIVRLLIAAILIILVAVEIVVFPQNVLLLAITVIISITAIAGICPLYTLLGINSCSSKRSV